MNSSVLAVVVCHNPEINALEIAITATCSQVAEMLIVDNGSANIKQVQGLIQRPQFKGKIHFIESKDNIGLGAAHNIGIQYAADHSFKYVLILDQDSVPNEGMVSALVTASQVKQTKQRISAVGACYLNADNGSESFFVRFGKLKFKRQYCVNRDSDGCVEADFLISSGSLFSVDSLNEVGLMDESLFIDHVDTEWFLRAKSKSYLAYGVCDAIMTHGLGEKTHRLNLGRERNVPQHKPFRYYYIFRNSVALYKRSYPSFLWKWNDIQRLCMIALMFGLFKSPRMANLKMMLRGIADGLRGKSGPAEFS